MISYGNQENIKLNISCYGMDTVPDPVVMPSSTSVSGMKQ